jgi:hypothetical protein
MTTSTLTKDEAAGFTPDAADLAVFTALEKATRDFKKAFFPKVRDLPATTTLSQLLTVCFKVTDVWSPQRAYDAGRQCAWFAIEHFSLDDLVIEVAKLAAAHPDDSFQFTRNVLRTSEVPHLPLLKSPSVMLLPQAAFTDVLSKEDRPRCLKYHRAVLSPSLSDEELDLAFVLLDAWSGSLVSLAETTRSLLHDKAA